MSSAADPVRPSHALYPCPRCRQLIPAPLSRKYGAEVAALVDEVRQEFTCRLRQDLVVRTVPDLEPLIEPPVPRAKDAELP